MSQLNFVARDDIEKVWDGLKDLIQVAIDRAVHGEYILEDVFDWSMRGEYLLAYIEEDEKVLMVLVLTLTHYPRMKLLNVIGMAGERMGELFDRHHEEIAEFARSTGAKCFEATCSPGMSKMLQKYQWYQPYEVCRFDL